ncbi:protein Jumonji isoform X2 [Hydra vulgaris]|uniref:Protein Jumonji isoform X2 n=1 Tax=Hydra vulgaris TaxID=6087 RepID=A0ABM4BEC7_HYDVU
MKNAKRKGENIKTTAKKLKLPQYAQRKFASVIPSSPKATSSSPQSTTLLKVEDFIDFLCMRGSPIMPQELEKFAIQENCVWDDNFEEQEKPLGLIKFPEKKSDDFCFSDNQVSLLKAPVFYATIEELNHFFDFVQNKVDNEMKGIFSIIPSENFIALSYADEKIKFVTKTTHVHRLKIMNCDSSVKLECIKRQLVKENIVFSNIPKIGSCELDLPLLCDTVELFGGLETASNLHWKSIADHLNIPKNVGKRISKLEDVYLKYVLPFTVLPSSEKLKFCEIVSADTQFFISLPNEIENKKSISVNNFQRVATNIKNMYLCNESSSEDIETLFWKHVSDGNRHIAALSASICCTQVPLSRNVPSNTTLNLQEMYSAKDSILKHVGKIKDLTVPRLLYESLFSTSKWTLQSNHFNTLSYIRFGSDKIWYVVPVNYTSHFEEILFKMNGCLLEPSELILKGIPIVRCLQKAGQYVVVSGGCYFLTISTGYCSSEIVNFATDSWFTSKYFCTWEPSLSNCLPIKVLLSFVKDNLKNNIPGYISDMFREKLFKFKELLEITQKSVRKAGISKGNSSLKWKDIVTCQSCGALCFPFYGRFRENKKIVFCIIETLNMIESGELSASNIFFELLVSIYEIERILRRFNNLNDI